MLEGQKGLVEGHGRVCFHSEALVGLAEEEQRFQRAAGGKVSLNRQI